MFEIRHMVTELVRLSTLDPSLSEERRFVADLDAGLEQSTLGGQLDTAAVWLHGKLLSSSEEGQQVDRARIIKKLLNVSKFMVEVQVLVSNPRAISAKTQASEEATFCTRTGSP